MPILSSLQAPQVGVVTICGAAKVVRGVQWKKEFSDWVGLVQTEFTNMAGVKPTEPSEARTCMRQ